MWNFILGNIFLGYSERLSIQRTKYFINAQKKKKIVN